MCLKGCIIIVLIVTHKSRLKQPNTYVVPSSQLHLKIAHPPLALNVLALVCTTAEKEKRIEVIKAHFTR